MSIEIVDVKPFHFTREVPVWHLKLVVSHLATVHFKEYILIGLPTMDGANYLQLSTVSDGKISYLIDSIRTMELRPIPKG